MTQEQWSMMSLKLLLVDNCDAEIRLQLKSGT